MCFNLFGIERFAECYFFTHDDNIQKGSKAEQIKTLMIVSENGEHQLCLLIRSNVRSRANGIPISGNISRISAKLPFSELFNVLVLKIPNSHD